MTERSSDDAFVIPRFDGAALPFAGAVDGEAPLVSLVRKLYTTQPAPEGPLPKLEDIPVFSFEHDCNILREPFKNAAGVFTRACLLGDDCIGRSKSIAGNQESNGGIVLTELMSPAELETFMTTGNHPEERRTCLLCARMNIHAAYLFARKSTSFPPNAVLNCFVNAAGEGEYKTDALIPTPEDGTWHGVVGSVCGLNLNTLQLKQAPDRSWYVDQQALRATAYVSVNTVTLLYRGAKEPRVWLAEFFSLRERVSDANILFDTFSSLQEARPKLNHPPTTEYLSWPDGAVKSFLHRLLFYRLNRLNLMLTQSSEFYGIQWTYYMQLYVDAHIPMALLFERGEKLTTFTLKYTCSEHTLPDFTPYAVAAAVNAVTPEGLTALQRKAEANKPRTLLIHLLTKSLPEYCQTKSLHQAIVKCISNRELCAPLFNIFQCALLGNFLNCKTRLPFETRKQFILGFTETTAAEFLKALPATEHLSLYVMRAYVLLVLPLCPPLKKLAFGIAPLAEQESRVFDALRIVRHSGSTDWTAMFGEPVLESLKKTHKRVKKKKHIARGVLDQSTTLLTSLRRTAARRGMKREGVAFDAAEFTRHVKRARYGTYDESIVEAGASVATTIMNAIFPEVDDAGTLVQSASKKQTFVFDTHILGDDTLRQLADFAAAVDTANVMRIMPLPKLLVAAQHSAVLKRFECNSSDTEVIDRVAKVLVCVNCGVRNFFLSASERKTLSAFVSAAKRSTTRSAGYRKLASDLTLPQGIETLRCVETPSCCKYPLMHINLLAHDAASGEVTGGALVLRGESVMISPCCGYLCHTAAVRCYGDSWDCPKCAETRVAEATNTPDPRICAICTRRSQLKVAQSQSLYLRDAEGRVLLYGFCRSHFRTWARTKHGFLTLAFLTANIANKNANGLVLTPT